MAKAGDNGSAAKKKAALAATRRKLPAKMAYQCQLQSISEISAL
jgi:hypothetical protein